MQDVLDLGDDVLATWLHQQHTHTGSTRDRDRDGDRVVEGGELRFAFYGRMSTQEHQDHATSAGWQRAAADDLVAGRGRIVAEYFDIGYSRRRAWSDRPQAAALLAALADPARGFDAVVVGEYERAFCGTQLLDLAPVFAHHGVQVWLTETDGPIDLLHNPTHQALIMLLGAHSRREILRSRFRVLAAMTAQVRDQGRYLGGRPPYGYRLVDAGPHPNTAHARWGRRLHRLEPDPVTAGQVQWMFTQRLAGHSVAGIARALNYQHVPCPSHVDPDRNRHRNGRGWTLRTVAAILANPRYTGRQVWNRQATDHNRGPAQDRVDPSDRRHRRRPMVHATGVQDWVISTTVAHPGLISEQDFVAAQTVHAARPTQDGSTHGYLLAGLLVCGVCGRRMDSHWVNHRPGYRCRHGTTSANPTGPDHPKYLYVRQDRTLAYLTREIGDDLDPHDLAHRLRSGHATITFSDHGWSLTRG